MKIIRGLKALEDCIKGSAVTIGVFDGLHIGHTAIIKKVVASARKAYHSSVVVTFDPHPLKVLRPDCKVPSLISLKHRIKLIKELGVNILVIVKFSRSFSNMSPEKFIKNILVDKLHAKEIYVGENFYFGEGARADAEILRRLSGRYDFRVTTVKPVKILGHIVSSSLLRELIVKGELHKATRLLGRPVSVFGTVVKGSGIARGLGCPTANINPHHEIIPPRGVYAVRVISGKREFRGIVNIGFRPTFYSSRDEEPTVEVHLFGYKGNLYNKEIEVYFIKKIRDERKFRSKDALIKQIKSDMALARKMLYK